jgi:hypothetical protein
MKYRRSRLVTIVVVGLMATLCGCSRFRELMGLLNEIKDLQQRLQQQTGQSGLNINLTNDTYFFIKFVNSPLAKLPAEQKKSKALEVARLTYQDWPKRAQLTTVTVVFETNYDFVFVHYSNSMDSFEFQVSELARDNVLPPVKQTGTGH